MDTAAENRGDGTFEHGYGWRARIGMLVPGAVDETISKQFYRMAPPGVTLVKVSLHMTGLTIEDITQGLARIDDAAQELGKRKVGCIILGGSPSVLVDGPGSEAALAKRIEDRSGVPATAAQTAAIEAMHHLGMRDLAVATPFNDELNAKLKSYLETFGFVVRNIRHLGIEYRSLMSLPLREVYDLALHCFSEAGKVDGLYFPGAPFPVVDLIERLERELSTTVVSSLQASLWKGLRLVGASVAIEGYGRLLRDGTMPA